MKEEKDLFEHYETLPKKVQDILSKADDNMSYKACEKLLRKLEPLGYTFDYGLCGSPFNLRVMKKSIYYVVEKELQSFGNVEETTGAKTITIYNIDDGKIVKFFDLDLDNSDNSIECIIDYLIDNGHTEEDESGVYDSYYKEFDFIQL